MRSDPVLAKKAKRAIEEAMDATRPVWSKEAETFVDQPDHKTRMVAVELYLHNTVGLPVQRTENLNINKTVARDSEKHPPAAIAEMRRIIAKGDAEMAKRAAAPPVNSICPLPTESSEEPEFETYRIALE